MKKLIKKLQMDRKKIESVRNLLCRGITDLELTLDDFQDMRDTLNEVLGEKPKNGVAAGHDK